VEKQYLSSCCSFMASNYKNKLIFVFTCYGMEYTLPRSIIIAISYRPTNVITTRQIEDESGTVTHFSSLFFQNNNLFMNV